MFIYVLYHSDLVCTRCTVCLWFTIFSYYSMCIANLKSSFVSHLCRLLCEICYELCESKCLITKLIKTIDCQLFSVFEDYVLLSQYKCLALYSGVCRLGGCCTRVCCVQVQSTETWSQGVVTPNMASTEVTRHNREVLASLDVGDLVEFPRGNYSHWAVYLGEW